ncbi:hypothetical protein ASG43_04790 [Aureimonas sp. Leaf454]|uniref:AMP-binding protein n=1 Tax=Aureimonas sp. Leaf454 TaxID=1736381 RepID=UPI0006FFD853|nr:AMP-binding protein [Aureimonas sp. Leaf454]KQT54862.1 hypothetical protein ASG43_04790 [Aureimonas sp. Leaf454]
MSTSAFHTIVDRLFERAAAQPDQRAYRFHEARAEAPTDLSIGALDEGTRRIAAALQARGLKGERVVLALPHAPAFILAFFGCLAAGAMAVPVPQQRQGRSDRRFLSVLADARPALVIADAASAEWMRERAPGEGAAPVVTTVEELMEEPGDFRRERFAEADVAVLQYTSGSTGDPKGVMVSHGNIMENARIIAEKLRVTPQSRGVLWLPFYHDMGLVGAVILPMFVHGTADLMSPQAFVQSPMTWLRKLSEIRATTAVAPNFALERCCDMATPESIAELDLSGLVCLLTGSEPVNATTLERFCATFAPAGFRRDACLPAYGLAEATLLATGNLHDGVGPTIRSFDRSALAAHRVEPATGAAPGVRLVGNGAPEGRVRIADPETGRSLPAGAIGEIWLTGPSIASGYWNRPDTTAAAFGARLSDEAAAGPFYRTGDLGFLLDDDLFVTGRLKDLIIVRGRNLYPQDIEETATRDLPELATGAAAAFPVDRGRGEEVVLVVEATRGGLAVLKDEAGASALATAVLQRLSEGCDITPAEICVVQPGRVPRTSSGKIQRAAARQEWFDTGFEAHCVHRWIRPSATTGEAEASAAPVHVHDRGSLEAWLIERLAHHSGQPPHLVDLDEPFASYGLDSVTAIEMISAINALAIGNRAVEPVDLYDHPTIQRLLDHMFQSAVPQPSSDRRPVPAAAGPQSDLDREAAALRALLDG